MIEKIPKIIHQIWIGDKPQPTNFMDTWKEKHPDFEYIRWTEDEIKKREFIFTCQSVIDKVDKYPGKADIMRLEILQKYGGIYLDADSICIEPLDESFLEHTAFAAYENENIRGTLVANGTMGFVPNHELCNDALKWIIDENNLSYILSNPPWISLGPFLLTKLIGTKKYPDFYIYPSFTFLPYHFGGDKYTGHKKVYAYQEWGSTKQKYDIINEITLPLEYLNPETWVSVLIPSYNTKHEYILECLESIKKQKGHFGIEIVWVNDGSSAENTTLLKKELELFEKTTRFTKVIYIENETNKGLGFSLSNGVLRCSNEIICRMDADDIMRDNRLQTQIDFMNKNKDCVLCGSQIQMFRVLNNVKSDSGVTSHQHIIDVDIYKIAPIHWIMNHPTFCFRKKEIIEIGNYNSLLHSMCEDLELIVRVLKHYKKVYNIQEVLLDYRLHEDQLTYGGGKLGSSYWNPIRNKMIKDILG